jgi:hypothetical protein
MNKYYPSTALEAENLLTEAMGDNPNAIVIIKSRDNNPVEVLRHEGMPLAFSSLDDCRSLCKLLVDAYEEGHDDGSEEGYDAGYEAGENGHES